jgi:hypothetical protein
MMVAMIQMILYEGCYEPNDDDDQLQSVLSATVNLPLIAGSILSKDPQLSRIC